MAKITFSLEQREVSFVAGKEFLELLSLCPDLPIKFGCRRGDCKVCQIEILEGEQHLSKRTKQEQGLAATMRLACQCAINGDLVILSKIQ